MSHTEMDQPQEYTAPATAVFPTLKDLSQSLTSHGSQTDSERADAGSVRSSSENSSELDDGTEATSTGDEAEEDLEKGKSSSPSIDATVAAIMDVLESFSLQQQGNDVFYGRQLFGPRVRRHVLRGRKIPMVLPAFPAKSINTVDKVLGPRPDFGEELALDRLNDLCTRIQKVYTPGAMVLIATDGACYNDLTGVRNDDLWQYGVEIRRMAADKGYRSIRFVRIMNLLGLWTEEQITKETYVSLLEPSRRALMERYGEQDFDANACIKNDPDYKMTYDGYAKFLKKDLAYGPLRDSITSGKKWKAKVSETAKAMIGRGVAFAELIRQKYPTYVRLSIHPSTGLLKISMPMIPQPDSFSMTPWHCAVAVDVQGRFRTAHVGLLRETHDVVCSSHNGGAPYPYLFRERSPLYRWDADVVFEHRYGGGLVVRSNNSNNNGADGAPQRLSEADKMKLAELAVLQGSVEVKGFAA